MQWMVEYTNEFGEWWESLDEALQDSIAVSVGMLESLGPALGFPHSSKIKGSKLTHLREMRLQYQGRPNRILYAFDPRRAAILLIGGDKTGKDDWYDKFVPQAEKLYQVHLLELEDERVL